MKYKCLILDHDDTALDSTRQLHHPAYCEMLKVMRPDAPLPDLKEFIMLNFDPGFVPHLKENLDFTDEEIDIEYDMWLKYVDGKCADFFPGWLELIRDFQAGSSPPPSTPNSTGSTASSSDSFSATARTLKKTSLTHILFSRF